LIAGLLSRGARAAAACIAFVTACLCGTNVVVEPQSLLGVPVFTYHMVDSRIPHDRIGNALTVTPEQFESQLRTLTRLGLRTVTAEQLVADLHRGYVPSHTVVLTFDDGYADARSVVLPLLERYHEVATFYVISGTIGSPRHLSWRDIRALHNAGMEIGAHGREHVDLTELNAHGQLGEVEGCARALHRWAKIDPETYAYPSGRYNTTTLTIMHRAGLAAAFTEEYGYVHTLASPYRLPRIRILRQDAIPMFSTVVSAL
jgi:peptidoglycan/xylan/chitin deacetylase (PgdA/CDA1 family)